MERIKITITDIDIQKQVKRKNGESLNHYQKRCAGIKKTLQSKQYEQLLNPAFDFEKEKKLSIKDSSETNEEFRDRVKRCFYSSQKFNLIKMAEESYKPKNNTTSHIAF